MFMEKKIREIISKAGDIGEKISRLQGEGSPPSIEVDLILGDIRTLYEQVRELQYAAPGATADVSGTGSPVHPAEEPEVEPPQDVSFELDASDETPGEKGKEQQAGGKPDAEASVSSAAEEEPIPAEKSPRPGPSGKTSGTATLADKLKGDKKFINESIAENRGKQDISSKIHSKPIQNIGTALGLNDRFKLINDLFQGDKESFQNTIRILDGASNFNEAFSYITSSFDWDMEEDSVQLLLDLVRRKFIVNLNE